MIILPSPSTPPAFITQSTAFYEDVLFYADADRNYLLDYYVPQGVKPAGGYPCLIALHGGSFISGDKDFINSVVYDDLINDCLTGGVAVISIQYKLLDDPVDSEGIPKSIKSAFRNILQVKRNASVFDIDKDKLVYFGVSAGGYISQVLSSKEFAGKVGGGLLAETNMPVAAMSYLPNATLDFFRQAQLDLWQPSVTIDSIITANATFAANCKRWYAIEGTVTTMTDLDNPKSRGIMNQIDPYSRGFYTAAAKPLYLIHDKEYIKTTSELEKLVHPAFAPDRIKEQYDANSVECWILGIDGVGANGNPVPTTVGIEPNPANWIIDKLGA